MKLNKKFNSNKRITESNLPFKGVGSADWYEQYSEVRRHAEAGDADAQQLLGELHEIIEERFESSGLSFAAKVTFGIGAAIIGGILGSKSYDPSHTFKFGRKK